VVIEGHGDERGTREYNLALGERRADAVRSFLLSAGASPRQVETVSYGEERPEDPGHDEAALARNRRAILIYR
jgi:peptidoglycan-associated lipoprotein